MISPELLRYYPFFTLLQSDHLINIALIAEDITYTAGEIIFREGEPANRLYFLLEGCVDLYYSFEGMKHSSQEKGIPVGEINIGEPFGISAIIEPHIYTSTAWSTQPSRVIKFEADELRNLLLKDRRLAYILTHSAAKAAMERLYSTRIQLAAAWA